MENLFIAGLIILLALAFAYWVNLVFKHRWRYLEIKMLMPINTDAITKLYRKILSIF